MSDLNLRERVAVLERTSKGLGCKIEELEKSGGSGGGGGPETDPIFSTSAAAGITYTDRNNWTQAYDKSITGASASGTSTITLTFTRQDGTTFPVSFSGGSGSSGFDGTATNYSGLPAANLHSGETWVVMNSQGTRWLPGSVGGNFYPKGFWTSDGSNWSYLGEIPYQSNNSQIAAGTDNLTFITPAGLTYWQSLQPAYEPLIGYVTENAGNKVNDLSSPNNTTYPSTNAVSQALLSYQPAGTYVNTFNGRSGTVVPQTNDYTFAQIGSKPTTLSGYGITDAYPSSNPSGYITASSSNNLTNKTGNISQWTNDSGYLTSFTETDPTVPSHVKAITTTNISNWNLAYTSIRNTTDDLPEGSTNLYFTQARSRQSISLTTTGSGASTYNNTTGVLNIPTPTTPPVTSVNGQTGAVVLTTDTVNEGVTNLYWTNSRFDTRFNTKTTADLAEGTNLYYTDERAQDSIGSILVDSSTIDFTYDDAAPTITAIVIDGSISNIKVAAGIDAAKIGNGSVSNTEYQYLDGVTSAIQTQFAAKQDTLVSGTNIKTINGTSVLGSGNIVISGGGTTVNNTFNTTKSDQSPNPAGSQFGLLGGTINGSNTVFTVSNGSYATGTLVVYRNGQKVDAGTIWSETSPGSGTFTFVTAPLTTDTIAAEYNTQATATGNTPDPIVTKTSNYTIATTDKIILVDASAGTVTISLPAAASVKGYKFYVKKIENSVNSVIIDPNGAELIEGMSTNSISTLNTTRCFVSDGIAWYLI